MAEPRSPQTAYYAQTLPGIEQIAWKEISQALQKPTFGEYLFTKEKNGLVLFSSDASPANLLALRTTEDIFINILDMPKFSRDWRDLRQTANEIEKTPFLTPAIEKFRQVQKLSKIPTYRVISRKVGDHQYRRMDLEEAVVKGLERRYSGRWKLVEDDAEIEIWVNLLGSRLLCGLRLSDRSMRHRDYRVSEKEAALRPSVAAAMVLLTDPQDGETFMDPMCGSGTLLAERTLIGKGKAGRILGGDLDISRLNAGRNNTRRLKCPISFTRWSVETLPLGNASIDKIAVNPPFGKKIGTRDEVQVLYPLLFAEMERVLKPGGKIVLVSSEYELVKQVIRDFPTLQIMGGYSVALLGQWGRIYHIKKTG